MGLFKNIKVGDNVYGVIYGKGIVRNVWGQDSEYPFEVEYPDANGQVVPYTLEGIPAWAKDLNKRTVFFKNEIDLMEYDFSPVDEILKPKEILKLKLTNQLEMRCASGIWFSISDCPEDKFEEYIINEKWHLFRKLIIKI